MKYYKLSEEEKKRLVDWWRWLDEHRGDRAQLRRATSAEDILLMPAFLEFLKRVLPGFLDSKVVFLSDAAFISGMIARVKSNNENQTFSKSLSQPTSKSQRPAMSQQRFLRLQKSRTEQEFFINMHRAIQLLEGRVNIPSLAQDCFHWLHEYRHGAAQKPQNRLAVRWASDYYLSLKDS